MRVGTELIVGTEWRLSDALDASEDSRKVNPSFIERLNLTIRQGSAYLHRRSPCHARKKRTLDEHLELLRCHYNFVRPHAALRFGGVTRTPAMQAGLVSRRLRFRDIFEAQSRAGSFVLALRPGHGYHEVKETIQCAA